MQVNTGIIHATVTGRRLISLPENPWLIPVANLLTQKQISANTPFGTMPKAQESLSSVTAAYATVLLNLSLNTR